MTLLELFIVEREFRLLKLLSFSPLPNEDHEVSEFNVSIPLTCQIIAFISYYYIHWSGPLGLGSATEQKQSKLGI